MVDCCTTGQCFPDKYVLAVNIIANFHIGSELIDLVDLVEVSLLQRATWINLCCCLVKQSNLHCKFVLMIKFCQ